MQVDDALLQRLEKLSSLTIEDDKISNLTIKLIRIRHPVPNYSEFRESV